MNLQDAASISILKDRDHIQGFPVSQLCEMAVYIQNASCFFSQLFKSCEQFYNTFIEKLEIILAGILIHCSPYLAENIYEYKEDL